MHEESPYKEIIEIEDDSFSLELIESIAADEKIKQIYKNKHKNALYSKILLSLTHEKFEEREAEKMWYQIIEHMKSLNRKLGRNVGVSVASIDYLSNIKNKISDPLIIEEKKSDFITGATTRDELTRLYLRSVFDVVLSKEIEEAHRNSSKICLLMIDIDDFKKVNDEYGHLKGDEVLNIIGCVINDTVRKMDFAARYGGEELSVIMPQTDARQALKAAERIRQKISQIHFKEFRISVSIGISQLSQNANTPEELIKSADLALYKAKNKGKNRVEFADL